MTSYVYLKKVPYDVPCRQKPQVPFSNYSVSRPIHAQRKLKLLN